MSLKNISFSLSVNFRHSLLSSYRNAHFSLVYYNNVFKIELSNSSGLIQIANPWTNRLDPTHLGILFDYNLPTNFSSSFTAIPIAPITLHNVCSLWGLGACEESCALKFIRLSATVHEGLFAESSRRLHNSCRQ